MNKFLIIGYGVVGHNLDKELSALKCDVYDKYKTEVNTKKDGKYDIAFICVDTPLKDGMVDFTEVRNAINENDAEIYVIKSTVPVGITDQLKKETGKRIVFSPEYYGGTQHCNNHVFDFTILGGEKRDCVEVQQVFQRVYDGRHVFHLVDSKSAEMTKFMENSWLAVKVTFCCEFARACEKAGINYETVRELFLCDPRVNPSHTFVYSEHPYFDSHCLNKDVPSIANQFDIILLKDVLEINRLNKK